MTDHSSGKPGKVRDCKVDIVGRAMVYWDVLTSSKSCGRSSWAGEKMHLSIDGLLDSQNLKTHSRDPEKILSLKRGETR